MLRHCSGTLHHNWKNDIVRRDFIAAFSVKKWRKAKLEPYHHPASLKKERNKKRSETEEIIHNENDDARDKMIMMMITMVFFCCFKT